MSINMSSRAVSYIVKAGARSTLQLSIKNNDGTAKDLSNDTTFSTGKWKVWNPAGTLLINGTIVFTTRATGIVSYTLVAADTVIGNAGVWEGEVEIKDTSGVISEQTQSFNFTIEESY